MADLLSHPHNGETVTFNQSGWIGHGAGERKVTVRALNVEGMGAYKCTVRLKQAAALFSNRRNLIDSDAKAGETSYFTLLTEYIPSMQNTINADKTLYAAAAFGEIESFTAEKAEPRNVFIAGDSTLADQFSGADYYPFDSYAGWGQMLSAYLRRDAVCNFAHSGLTGRCFIEDGHFDIAKKYIRKGDLMLIQFGHNDQKRRYLQPDKLYTKYIAQIANEAAALGAQPVLISPISRVPSRDKNGYFDLLFAHAEAMEKLARHMSLPFIDLHKYSFDMFCDMGETCKTLFKDMTHSNDRGAFKMAGFIARSLRDLGLAEICEPDGGFIVTDEARNPARPTPAPLPFAYVDIADVKDRNTVYEGVQAGLLDPCVLHMHPFEPVSRASFVQLFFRAAGLSGIPTNGEKPYPDVNAYEFDSAYAMACREMKLINDGLYRPDDMISAIEINAISANAGFKTRIETLPAVPNKYSVIEFLLKIRKEAHGAN